MYMRVCVFIYIYIYREREREREDPEKERERRYREREREVALLVKQSTSHEVLSEYMIKCGAPARALEGSMHINAIRVLVARVVGVVCALVDVEALDS